LKTKLSPGQLSESMHELWSRVEKEAQEYKISPEEALIRSIKRCSFILNDYLKKLRQQTNEILPAPASQRLDSAAAYVEELNSNLENSKDIFEVKEEVLQKAKQKLDDLVSWSSSLVNRNTETTTESNTETTTESTTEFNTETPFELNSESHVSNGAASHTSLEAFDKFTE